MIQKCKTILFFISVFLMVAQFAACKKFLDKKQNATAVVPSTLSDLQALLDDGTMNFYLTPSYSEVTSDEFFIPEDILSSFPAQVLNMYTWQHYDIPSGMLNDWGTAYRAIYQANLALDLLKNVDRTSMDAKQWDNIDGSALFLRSYNFLNLLWQYAKTYDSTSAKEDWGIALRLTSDFNQPSVRANNEQSYEQVIKDVKAAILLLPDYPYTFTRPSKAGAYGLLARCYLSMRKYKEALLYSDSCLRLNHNLIDFRHDEDLVNNGQTDASFKQFNKETIFYTGMNIDFDIFTYTGYIDSFLVSLYEPGDLRKDAFFKDNGNGFYYFKGSYSGNTYSYFTGISTNEILLIRSECRIRSGDIENGITDLNSLLVKRYADSAYIPIEEISAQDALEKVLVERRKELLFHGNRWSDIKRLNKEGRNIVLTRIVNGKIYTLKPNDNFYALPLPDDLIKITGMPQN